MGGQGSKALGAHRFFIGGSNKCLSRPPARSYKYAIFLAHVRPPLLILIYVHPSEGREGGRISGKNRGHRRIFLIPLSYRKDPLPDKHEATLDTNALAIPPSPRHPSLFSPFLPPSLPPPPPSPLALPEGLSRIPGREGKEGRNK